MKMAVIFVVLLHFLLQVVDVSAQSSCIVTPLNPTTLTATGGTLVSGTTDVRIQCVCTTYSGVGRWYDINTNFVIGATNPNYVAGSPYHIRNAVGGIYSSNVTLVIPTFTDSYDGTYNCGIRVSDTSFTSPSAAVTLNIAVLPPTNVRATGLTPRSVVVTWNPSPSPDITGYLILFSTTALYTYAPSVTVYDRNATSYTHTNLEENTLYTIYVRSTFSGNRVSAFSNRFSITTFTDVPSSPPQNVMVRSINPASLWVSWQAPTLKHHNGIITGYVIECTKVGSRVVTSENVNSRTGRTISGLVPYGDYSVTVAAVNINGTGRFNIPVIMKSGQYIPTEPKSLMIVNVTDTTVTLSWMPPDPPNGIITQYQVEYRSDTSGFMPLKPSNVDMIRTVTGLFSNTQYMFRVTAFTVEGKGPVSKIIVAHTMVDVSPRNCTVTPLNPTTLTATGGVLVSGTVNVTSQCVCTEAGDQVVRWYGPDGVIILQQHHDNYVAGSPYVIRNSNTNVTLVIPTFNDSYSCTFNCGIRVTDTSFTSPSAAVTLTTVRTAPKSLMIVNVTDTTVTLSWMPPDLSTGIITQYEVEYRSDTSGFMLLQPSNIHLIRTVTGLSSNTQYMFRITAFTVEGNGPVSKIIVAHTLISTPTDVTATALTPRTVEVAWKVSSTSGITSYLISYTATASYASGGSVIANGGSTTSHVVTNLEENTLYTITVQATNSSGMSANSNEVSVTTYADVPSLPPQNVTVTSVNPASLKVSWEQLPEIYHNGLIIGYVIQYVRVGSSDIMSENVNNGTTHTISGLVAYVDYSVIVAAVNNVNGTGVFSYPVVGRSGEDVPTTPRLLMVVNITNTTVTLSWMPPASPNGIITHYQVQYKRSESSSNFISLELLDPILNYTVIGLTGDTVYVFRVRAFTAVMHGPPSNDVTALTSLLAVTVMPSSQSVEVTHNATFTTRITGVISNYFTYQWKHNGTIISGETEDILMIINVMESNSGHYQCIATNQFGYTNVSNVVVLTVTRRLPVISHHPMDLKIRLVNNYTNISLSCEADGALSYNWERQNDVIPSDSTGVNTNTLTLINLQPADAGNYRCVATNASGSSESKYAKVTISVTAPHVLTHPTSTSAADPFSALFSCSYQAFGYLIITWYRNGSNPVPKKAYSTLMPSVNVTTSILTIPNVTIGDVDTYHCVGTVDRITVKSLSANLFLADSPSPPVVMAVPIVNLTVNNYYLTMKCLPDKGNFNYKWIKKNDVLLSRAQGVNTSQLIIVNLAPKDSGDYQCVISNSTGTISSNFFTVNVIVSPPVITKQPTNEVVEVYSSITLECKVQGYGYITIEWRKLGSALPNTAIVNNTMSKNGVSSILEITNVVGYYGGLYCCVAINIGGQTTSVYANLSVQVPCPEIIKPYRNITVLVNQAADLHCFASSCGGITYNWIKNASNLSASAIKNYVTKNILYFNQIVLTYQLTIPNAQLSDEGWYCCLATNECGTTERCIWLEVNTIPTIIQQPMSLISHKISGEACTLQCLANGLEPLSYLWQMYQSSNDSWTRPSVRAINITSSKLVFSKLTEEDEGIYRCIVFSDDDSVVSDNATITVYGPPEITYISPNMTYLEGSKSSLVCNATNDADATDEVQIAWFSKNLTSLYPVVQDNRVIIHNVKNLMSRQIYSVLLFDPVSRTDEGVYICKASNHPQSSNKRSTNVMIKRVCSILQNPANGRVFLQDDDTALFVCLANATVIGNPILTCINGNWNNPPPTCKL